MTEFRCPVCDYKYGYVPKTSDNCHNYGVGFAFITRVKNDWIKLQELKIREAKLANDLKDIQGRYVTSLEEHNAIQQVVELLQGKKGERKKRTRRCKMVLEFPEKEFRQWLDEAIENGFYENASTQEAQDEAIALWGFEQAKKQMREAVERLKEENKQAHFSHPAKPELWWDDTIEWVEGELK